MNKKTGAFLLFLGAFFLVIPGLSTAQTRPPASRLQGGINLYGAGRWREAVLELRRVQAEAAGPEEQKDALYWIALAELAAGEYQAALQDMDELSRLEGENPRYTDIPYHRGRAVYYLGQYDEALVLLKAYADSITVDTPGEGARKPAALYWMGECLYALGQLDKAQEVFFLIMEQYPQSAKYEASSYRLALINQKKIEAELLAILKWSHEESLKILEEYQRREHSYDQAIIAYQKRIADMLKDSRFADMEAANARYRRNLAEAENRISALEVRLKHAGQSGDGGPRGDELDKLDRVMSIRREASELQTGLLRVRQTLEEGR